MTAITKETCEELRETIERMFDEFDDFRLMGLKLEIGRITCAGGNVGVKLEFYTVEVDEFLRDPSLIGEDIAIGGAKYKIVGVGVGVGARSSKYPILADRSCDGVTYKFSAAAVRRALGKGGRS